MDLRQDKSLLQEQLAQRDALIAQLQHELVLLRKQVQALQEQLNKDSHNSHLPPSSDRFHRQPTSLRKNNGKKPGG
jgi:transposase